MSDNEQDRPKQQTTSFRAAQPKAVKRGFFYAIGQILKTYFIGVGIFFTVIPTLLMLAILISSRSSDQSDMTELTSSSYIPTKPALIQVEFDGPLVEQAPGLEEQIMKKIFGGVQEVSVSALRTMLRRAAKDPNVHGVHFEFRRLQAAGNDVAELRRLIKSYQSSGKKFYAWLSEGDNQSYLLSSSADEVYLPPVGGLSITGPVFFLTYLGDALRKIGVDFEVVRAGKYKSAFEPLVSNQPSRPVVEMYSAMEQNLRNNMVEELAVARQQDPEVVRRWLGQSFHTAPSAKQEGMISDVGYIEEQLDRIKASYKEQHKEDLQTISYKEYLKETSESEKDIVHDEDEGIGLIYAYGDIVMGTDGDQEGSIFPDSMRKQLEWAMEEDDIKSVVIRVNSPGGSANASDIIWHDVARLQAKKPVIVSMAGVAASGGYYISAPANKIFAEVNTITGSIGVIGALPNFAPFRDKYGVSFHVVTESERANLLNPGTRSSSFDKNVLEANIDHVYQVFLERVAAGRKMEVEQVHELAQGRVYTGLEALELGLVDELGGLAEAFQAAKEAAGFDPDKLYRVHNYEGDSFNLSECLKSATNMFKCLRDLETYQMRRAITHIFAPTDPRSQTLALAKRLERLFAKEMVHTLWLGMPQLGQASPWTK